MVSIKRETAKKCKIKELIEGRFIKREGWEPSYVETSRGRISRTNVFGVVINNEEQTLLVDDGTSQIMIRSFDESEKSTLIEIGLPVMVIGRPRLFNNNIYIVPEIIRKIDNPKWLEYRKKELETKEAIVEEKTEVKQEKKENNIQKETQNIDITDSILSKINELDKGFGVRIEEVIKHFEANSANITINKLIEKGDIFEIKPGIVKML